MRTLTLPDDHDLCIRTFLDEIRNHAVLKSKGVLHVGAHLGEEVAAYLDHSLSPIYLVEANPEILPTLTSKFLSNKNVHVIPKAVSDEAGEVSFIVHKTTKGGMESSGILELDRLGKIVPVFNSEHRYNVPSVTIDQLADEGGLSNKISLMVLDIQGAELRALKGATKFLRTLDAVICEVNLIENYVGCPTEKDVDDALEAAGFLKSVAIYHELYDKSERFPAWGECLWLRRD